jgi:hypothetical protein
MHRPKAAIRPAGSRRSADRSTDLDALLAAFDRCARPADRARIGAALATLGSHDPRIRGALMRTVEDDPVNGAALLSALGDRAAVPELKAALDRLLADPIADCVVCAAQQLVAVVGTIRVLGGSPSEPQLEEVEAVLARSAEVWIPADAPGATTGPRVREARPGPNDPCPCGSGRKYERCHRGLDGGESVH